MACAVNTSCRCRWQAPLKFRSTPSLPAPPMLFLVRRWARCRPMRLTSTSPSTSAAPACPRASSSRTWWAVRRAVGLLPARPPAGPAGRAAASGGPAGGGGCRPSSIKWLSCLLTYTPGCPPACSCQGARHTSQVTPGCPQPAHVKVDTPPPLVGNVDLAPTWLELASEPAGVVGACLWAVWVGAQGVPALPRAVGATHGRHVGATCRHAGAAQWVPPSGCCPTGVPSARREHRGGIAHACPFAHWGGWQLVAGSSCGWLEPVAVLNLWV